MKQVTGLILEIQYYWTRVSSGQNLPYGMQIDTAQSGIFKFETVQAQKLQNDIRKLFWLVEVNQLIGFTGYFVTITIDKARYQLAKSRYVKKNRRKGKFDQPQ